MAHETREADFDMLMGYVRALLFYGPRPSMREKKISTTMLAWLVAERMADLSWSPQDVERQLRRSCRRYPEDIRAAIRQTTTKRSNGRTEVPETFKLSCDTIPSTLDIEALL